MWLKRLQMINPTSMAGDVPRAHHGVRFPDERPECRHVLEVLRRPLWMGALRI